MYSVPKLSTSTSVRSFVVPVAIVRYLASVPHLLAEPPVPAERSVTRSVPLEPTKAMSVGPSALMPLIVSVVPDVCAHHVAPPSVLRSSVPPAPPTQMQPAASHWLPPPGETKSAAKSVELVPLVRCVHVLPRSAVVKMRPPLPTATPTSGLPKSNAVCWIVTAVGMPRLV